MGENHAKNQLIPLAITAIAMAITVSAIWAWTWNETRKQHDQISLSYLDRIEALEGQLQQGALREEERSSNEQDLIDKYHEALESRNRLEKNLTSANTKLGYLQESLEDYRLGNWESKYLAEKGSNDQIFAAMEQLEEEIEQIREFQEALLIDHEKTLEAERIKYEEQIARLNSELDASAKEISKLKKQPPVVVKQEKKTAEKSPNDYRSIRLNSLMSNVKGLSSREKLNILVKVIPTVPEGITTDELTKLVTDMSSADILSLIKSSSGNIHKTQDNNSTRLLLSKMNKADADAASKLLIN